MLSLAVRIGMMLCAQALQVLERERVAAIGEVDDVMDTHRGRQSRQTPNAEPPVSPERCPSCAPPYTGCSRARHRYTAIRASTSLSVR